MTLAGGASVDRPTRILLVAPNISRRMGGEGLKALQIHLELRGMGFEVHQVTHARVRAEIERDYPALAVDYVEDDAVQVALHRTRLGPLLTLLNAWQLHRRALRVADSIDPWVVHFTSPISPVQPYFRFPGHPVVIGPLNGNIQHPPAFRDRESRVKALTSRVLRPVQSLLGALFRGKRDAVILVAGGERTMRALRLGGCSDTQLVPTLDCGIPDALIDRPRAVQQGHNPRFVFLGRLVRYKACDLAIRAVAAADPRVMLDVIGDGPERQRLEALATTLGVADRIRFHGWMQPGPALYDRLDTYRGLVMPTLAEANGIAFQEAMTLGVPIICLDWGGPQELLGADDAVMIAPDDPAAVVAALAAAMTRLADDPDTADRLAARARARALDAGFRWRDLLHRWEDVYRRSAAEPRGLA